MDTVGIALFVGFSILLLGSALVSFIVLTEGRYFGKSLVRWLYDRLAGVLAAADEATRWDAFLRVVPIAPDERVLDVGTAAGHLPLAIASVPTFRGRAMGLDWSQPLIQHAQQQAQAQEIGPQTGFLVADARSPLPFSTATFDTVVCLGVLDALPQPGERLADLARLIRPGGQIVLSLARRVRLGDYGEAWFRRRLETLGFHDVNRCAWTRLYDLIVARR